MKEWHCPACKDKLLSKDSAAPESKKKGEGKLIIFLLLLAYFFVMKYLWKRAIGGSMR